MPILDHTIVASHDHRHAAAFVAELLGLPAPVTLCHFEVVRVGETTTLDFVMRDHVPNEFVRVNPLGLQITYVRVDQAFEVSRR